MQAALGDVSAQTVSALDAQALRGMGMSLRKAENILDFRPPRADEGRSTSKPCGAWTTCRPSPPLTTLKGVGVWTAEMILLFCLERRDVFSYGDLAIRRGLRMLYRHKTLDRERFERYRHRYSPCGSVASLYLWAVACGAVEGLSDPAADAPAGGAGAKKRERPSVP